MNQFLCLSENELDVIRRKQAFAFVDFTSPPMLVRCVGHFDKITTIESKLAFLLRCEVEECTSNLLNKNS